VVNLLVVGEAEEDDKVGELGGGLGKGGDGAHQEDEHQRFVEFLHCFSVLK
jgi:hypothetical protein